MGGAAVVVPGVPVIRVWAVQPLLPWVSGARGLVAPAPVARMSAVRVPAARVSVVWVSVVRVSVARVPAVWAWCVRVSVFRVPSARV